MDNLTAGNPVAHRIRVYYTGDDTLKEGEPLCYSFKTTKNWWGGSVANTGEVTASGTVDEGSHNSSKYMTVESPLRLSLSSDTPADGSKTITGSTTDFDTLQVGMFVSISGSDVTNGNYEITAISRSTESGVTNSTITLGNMTAATGTTADVATAIDNISAFAGVVAKGGWVGRSGPRVVDIYVPNGAVVPVRVGLDCVTGRTVLAVHTNEQALTTPHRRYAFPVGVAWETYTYSASTPGIVLAKLAPNMFIRQIGDLGSLLIDNEDTTDDVIVNEINVVSNQTGGQFTALLIKAESAAGASTVNQRGLALKCVGIVSASASAIVIGTSLEMELTGGTVGEYATACHIKLYENGATISSMGGRLSVLNLCCQVADTPTANSFSWVYFESHGAENPDFLFQFNAAVQVPMATQSSASVSHVIPMRIGGATYYIMVSNVA
jgi:hypothetical protein